DVPYSSETGRVLQNSGFLVPLRVHSGMEEIEELTDDALTYLNSREGAELLIGGTEGGRHHIHLEKLPRRLRKLSEMHPEKLPYEIRHILSSMMSPSRRGADWLDVDDGFALFYMTLLANRLAERVGASLLTPLPPADRLAVAARLDAQLHEFVPWGLHEPGRRWREYEAFGPRRRLPRTLAPAMLAQLAIERVAIAPDVPIDKLLKFKESHRDELGQFRAKIEQLAQSVAEDLPAEALRQRVSDIGLNEIGPAIANLKRALEGRRIRWFSEGLLKVAFLSAGPTTMLAAVWLVCTNCPARWCRTLANRLGNYVQRRQEGVDQEQLVFVSPFSWQGAVLTEKGRKNPRFHG